MKNEAGKSDQVFYLKVDDHEISFSEAFKEGKPYIEFYDDGAGSSCRTKNVSIEKAVSIQQQN